MNKSVLTNWSNQDKADYPRAYSSALIKGVSGLVDRYRTSPDKFAVVGGQPLFLSLATRTQQPSS